MSTEYGIFNAEGLIESGFYSQQLAEEMKVTLNDAEAYVSEVCTEHPDQPADECEEG